MLITFSLLRLTTGLPIKFEERSENYNSSHQLHNTQNMLKVRLKLFVS